ncbi:hypothetical protein [Microbacterium hominis]|uniref:DUF7847 domain-containing protein n=1 Tax=Microbacterium hominis TaxID=162426 RepID=A0A7D4PN39_9MICO|nr:hypothetical protein [Microbacterium hominis]QKJ19995.1 hypothetical protein HQM25_11930 [Microbacterium hominis]
MTAYPAWTPASRPGIIPLHPLTFGTILGRSFAALRHNPRVLLGFALGVQAIAYVVVLLAVGGIAFLAFSRLDTLRPGTDEFDQVMAGSIALTIVAGVVLGLAAGALSVVVQAIVIVEVAHAAVAEKLTLAQLWQQVRPVIWRLIGYTVLLILAVLVSFVIVGAAIAASALATPVAAVLLGILAVLAAIPLYLWLATKLLLVPAAIVIEHATIGQAIGRAWTLVRGRFWPALGIIVVISLVFSTVAQVVGLPFGFLSTGLTTIIAPTGAPEASAIVGIVVLGLLTQVVTLLVQAVALVVQATATGILYIDCRMRREGLDLDLLAYIDRRDAGASDLADPYRAHIGRVIAPRPPAPPPAAAPGYAPPPAAAPGYAPPPAAAPAYPAPPAPAAPATPASPAPAPPVSPQPTSPPPAPHRWAAPGQTAPAEPSPDAPTDR